MECEKEDPTPMPLLAEFFVPGSTPLIGVELKLLLSCLWNCTVRSRFLPSQEFCKWKKLFVKSHSFWNIFSPVLPFLALLIDYCSRQDFSFGDLKKAFLISCLDIYLLWTPYEEQRKTWESPTTWVLGIELRLSVLSAFTLPQRLYIFFLVLLLFLIFIILCVWVFVCVYCTMPGAHRVQESVRSLGTGGTDGCELTCGC